MNVRVEARFGVLITALCGAVLGAANALEPLAAGTRFDRVVEQAQAGSAADRRAFAEAAIGVLIRANRGEMARVAETMPSARARQWQSATGAYVHGLEQLRAALASAVDVQIVREADGAVRLIADSAQAMVSAPRLDGQAALEADVASATCAVLACRVASDSAVAGAVEPRAPEVRTEWSFSDRAPAVYSNADGLSCVFTDQRHLRLKRDACEAVMQELRLLADGLRGTLQHGGHIDWPKLAIRATGAGDPQRIEYDGRGGYFELALPYLGADEATWRGAIPWLQARLRGYASPYMISPPERLAYRLPSAPGANE